VEQAASLAIYLLFVAPVARLLPSVSMEGDAHRCTQMQIITFIYLTTGVVRDHFFFNGLTHFMKEEKGRETHHESPRQGGSTNDNHP
jgi:hypothetical protein